MAQPRVLQSYSSISINAEEESPLMEEQNNSVAAAAAASPSSRRAPRAVRFYVPVICFACLFLFVASTYIPSRGEMETARDYGVSFFGIPQMRSAQFIADSSFLTGRKHKKKLLKKIRQRGSDKHYTEAPEGCEATVLIIRHCEKGHVREHCAYNGFERSVYLASLFGDEEERWPAPGFIYALKPRRKKKLNFREMETVGPLAVKVGVTVDSTYSVPHTHDLVEEISSLLYKGDACGKLILISWQHSGIGRLSHHLGCGPGQGCPMDYHGRSFDEVWQLKYVYRDFDHSSERSLALPRGPEWRVFGSVQQEGFDPLAFSKLAGDYPVGGTMSSARWKSSDVEVAERKRKSDTKSWMEGVPEVLGGPREKTHHEDHHGGHHHDH